jgi:hypothetical protein
MHTRTFTESVRAALGKKTSSVAQPKRSIRKGSVKLLSDPAKGLENYTELFNKLTSPNDAIKVFCEVA